MKHFCILLTALLTWLPSNAKIKMGALFNDGMVLQQQCDAHIWGWATPNTKVTLKPSWDNKTVTCQSEADGKWQATLHTPQGNFTPYEITVSDGEKFIIKDVLIGEVWIGSGQSNMEMCLAGRPNRVIENAAKEIAYAEKYKGKLHLATVAHNVPLTPADDVKAQWQDCSSATVAPWSAVCYFFGSTLVDILNCPVGMISTCWGGSAVESWIPRNIVENYEGINLSEKWLKSGHTAAPTIRYNGMIHPIEGYNAKGFIWYQGEANVKNANQYAARLEDLITSWRSLWGQSEMPFYQVEIAPYKYSGIDNYDAAILREAQCEVTHNMSHVGMISTSDLVKDYEYAQIHPMMKRSVGERLAFMALARDYGLKGIPADYPEYKGMTVKDDKVYLDISNAKEGFNRFQGFNGFEICGADGIFHPATGSIEKNIIVLTSPYVPNPKHVRYCFKNFVIGNTTNVYGLPIIPFRTDK